MSLTAVAAASDRAALAMGLMLRRPFGLTDSMLLWTGTRTRESRWCTNGSFQAWQDSSLKPLGAGASIVPLRVHSMPRFMRTSATENWLVHISWQSMACTQAACVDDFAIAAFFMRGKKPCIACHDARLCCCSACFWRHAHLSSIALLFCLHAKFAAVQ